MSETHIKNFESYDVLETSEALDDYANAVDADRGFATGLTWTMRLAARQLRAAAQQEDT